MDFAESSQVTKTSSGMVSALAQLDNSTSELQDEITTLGSDLNFVLRSSTPNAKDDMPVLAAEAGSDAREQVLDQARRVRRITDQVRDLRQRLDM